jgi:uncharacterized repeat protein (TIGR01451 family)
VRGRLRRISGLCIATLALSFLLPLLAACGGGGQISVSIDGPSSGKPGDTARFVVSVVNNGPGDAPGVTVVVAMPNGFHYKSTNSISDVGSARTQPLDARVGSAEPQWGFWDIGTPSPQAGSTGRYAVDITFTADIEANPDTYNIAARAQGDNTSGAVTSKPLSYAVKPAPRLSVNARVDAGTLKAASTTTYRVTITNTGSDTAGDVGLLVALPPVMVFQASVTPFQGNASRNNPVDPAKGGVEVFYGGFTIPAASSAGPGYVVVAFTTLVVARPSSGTFPISLQVTDNLGDVVNLNNVAPVTVQGVVPTPTPSPGASVTPTASPSAG